MASVTSYIKYTDKYGTVDDIVGMIESELKQIAEIGTDKEFSSAVSEFLNAYDKVRKKNKKIFEGE